MHNNPSQLQAIALLIVLTGLAFTVYNIIYLEIRRPQNYFRTLHSGKIFLDKNPLSPVQNLSVEKQGRKYRILAWWGFSHGMLGRMEDILNGSMDYTDHFGVKKDPEPCLEECEYTRDLSELRTADVVLFAIDVCCWPFLEEISFGPFESPFDPGVRRPEQIYVLLSTDTPANLFDTGKGNIPRGFFNHTFTYRLDSTIPAPYYELVPLESEREDFLPDMSKKTRLVAWMVSHCQTASKREVLVEKLTAFVDVDVYGRCNNRAPPCDRKLDPGKPCYKVLGRTHKFYLSFENSLCEDYVTEKFFNVLDSNMVPVVYGQANYSHFAPSGSFIDVRDFPDVQTLARYLKRLDEREEEYLRYFEWKKHYRIRSKGWEDHMCPLCEKLTRGDLMGTKSIVEDAGRWWMRAKDGRSPVCRDPPAFLTGNEFKEQLVF